MAVTQVVEVLRNYQFLIVNYQFVNQFGLLALTLAGLRPSLPAFAWDGSTLATVFAPSNLLTSLTNSATSAIQTASTYAYDPLLVGGAVVLGGFAGAALGAAQTIVLRHHARHAKRWILGNAAGTTAPT